MREALLGELAVDPDETPVVIASGGGDPSEPPSVSAPRARPRRSATSS